MRKKLGQHFLIKHSVVRRILQALELAEDSMVLEIGPGKGALTGPLSKQVSKLLLVEKDPVLATEVETYFEDRPHVSIWTEDFLDLDWHRVTEHLGEKFSVVSNLPYQAGTAIFLKLIHSLNPGSIMVLMFQKEVADRLMASPSTKAYGSLSVITQIFCRARLLFEVDPKAFRPPPQVVSSVLKLKLRPEPLVSPSDLPRLEALLHAGFGHRRKMLRQNLKGVFPGDSASEIEGRLQALGASPQARAEELGVNQWIELLNQNP